MEGYSPWSQNGCYPPSQQKHSEKPYHWSKPRIQALWPHRPRCDPPWTTIPPESSFGTLVHWLLGLRLQTLPGPNPHLRCPGKSENPPPAASKASRRSGAHTLPTASCLHPLLPRDNPSGHQEGRTSCVELDCHSQGLTPDRG